MLRIRAPLSEYTRFGLGGPADRLIDCCQVDEFLKTYRESPDDRLVIGGGTNLLVADAGYRGTILRFTGDRMDIDGDRLTVESGANLEDVVRAANAAGLGGLESLMRIPGWVSGAVYGNAGAYGQSIDETVEAVEIFDGAAIRWLRREECGFAYRTSIFKAHRHWVILRVRLRLCPQDPLALIRRSQEIRAIRDAKFPPSMKCAGSIFKNCPYDQLPAAVQARVPESVIKGGKVPAAFFLEQVGAKGMSCGGIAVADYHANLIYNRGDGTAAEAVALIDELRARVLRAFGLQLEEEVQYVGFPDRKNH